MTILAAASYGVRYGLYLRDNRRDEARHVQAAFVALLDVQDKRDAELIDLLERAFAVGTEKGQNATL